MDYLYFSRYCLLLVGVTLMYLFSLLFHPHNFYYRTSPIDFLSDNIVTPSSFIVSSMRCVHDDDANEDGPYYAVHNQRSCLFQHVCVDSYNLSDWVILDPFNTWYTFFPKKFSLPLVYLSGRGEQRSAWTPRVWTNSTLRFEDVNLWPGGYLFFQLHAITNAGHLMLDNFMPMMLLRETFPTIEDPIVLLRDSCDPRSPFHDVSTDNDPGDCYSTLAKFFPLLSSRHNYISLLNVTQQTTSRWSCFESVIAGTGSFSFHSSTIGRSAMWTHFRSNAYSLYNIPPGSLQIREIRIGMHVKTVTEGHGRTIDPTDIDLFWKDIQELLPPCVIRTVPVKFIQFRLPDLSIDEQVGLLSSLHIFITPGGSSAFSSVFLRDNAVLITFPLCSRQNSLTCDSFEYPILSSNPNVHVRMYWVKNSTSEVRWDLKGSIHVNRTRFMRLLVGAILRFIPYACETDSLPY
jgi:hypothetical protein